MIILTEEFKDKLEEYLKLMQRHYDKVKDNKEMDLMNNTMSAMSLDDALAVLHSI